MRNLTISYRLASTCLYGLSLIVFYHAQPIAAIAYNDLCSSRGVTFHDLETTNALIAAFVLIVPPLFLGRSSPLVIINLILGVITIFGAGSLLNTAANTPYECFTQAGTYEDHTSGLDGFEMWFMLTAVLSYFFLTIDLAAWSIRKWAMHRRRDKPQRSGLTI